MSENHEPIIKDDNYICDKCLKTFPSTMYSIICDNYYNLKICVPCCMVMLPELRNDNCDIKPAKTKS